MRPRTGRIPPSLPVVLAIIALLLTGLYVTGLIIDWPGWLRGSNWVWVRRVPEMGDRFAWLLVAFVLGLAAGALALREGGWTRRRTVLFLAALVVLAPLLQLVLAAQHRDQPLSLVVLGASGFWQEGARIEDPLLFAREHAARMPTYADVHVRTQPPGWPLAYWALARAFARAPGAADFVGRWIHRYDCAAPELLGLDTAQLAAGSLRVIILALTGLGAPLLYAIGRRFYPATAARLAAVSYVFLPALLVFAGRFDAAYALLALLAVWLILGALLDGRWLAGLALALLTALGSFFTFTVLPIVGMALLASGACAVAAWGRRDRRLARLAWVGAAAAAALLLLWGGLRLAGVDGLAMWRASQTIHREYRLNYPAWFLFNFYDLAAFMGFVPFVGAAGSLIAASRRAAVATGRGLIIGWAAAVLLLNLSATVRAETGRLWLFLMPLGLLAGFSLWVRAASDRPPAAGRRLSANQPSLALLMFAAFLVQALIMGYLLGGRAGAATTPPPQRHVPGDARALDYRLGAAVALRGYRVDPLPDGARLTLYWQALDFPRAEYSVFVHALDARGATVSQSDGPPAAVPMWCWTPGEVVADERTLRGLAGPPAAFGVGLYDPATGQRLPVAPATPDDRIVLPAAE